MGWVHIGMYGWIEANARPTDYGLSGSHGGSAVIKCVGTHPIIFRPVAGRGCRRHKVLVLNPVSAANLTLLIGSGVVLCEH